jgi:hypothetical protein
MLEVGDAAQNPVGVRTSDRRYHPGTFVLIALALWASVTVRSTLPDTVCITALRELADAHREQSRVPSQETAADGRQEGRRAVAFQATPGRQCGMLGLRREGVVDLLSLPVYGVHSPCHGSPTS